MPFIQVGHENSNKINLYYEDHGSGDPIVLIHGWPLSGRSWEKQVSVFLEAGHRVITYDRRGFGSSSQPTIGYDYDTLAKDLDTIMTTLDLKNVTLIGFSMGGGEVARYLGTYGSERVKKAVFISAITPFLLKTSDNPNGVGPEVFDGIQKSVTEDRPAFLAGFFANFFNEDVLKDKFISPEAIQNCWNTAVGASPTGTFECVGAWKTDFRKDIAKIDIPVLIVHGDADRIVPFEASGKNMQALIKGSKSVVIKGGCHGLNWTHSEKLNSELLDFLAEGELIENYAVRGKKPATGETTVRNN